MFLRPLGALCLLALAAFSQPGPPPPPPAIARIAAQAVAARDANNLDQAVPLYRQALRTAPTWQQGWFDLGTIYYERDQYPQCRDAFRRVTALNARLSAGFALLGLCEFGRREFAPALQHLERASAIGLPNDADLTTVALYHAALLQTKAGNFERALQICRSLARGKPGDPQTILVAGLAGLRRNLFPQELPEGDRVLVIQLGSALLAGREQPAEQVFQRFDALVSQFPSTPNVHYAFAVLLLANEPDRGVAELKRELEIDPNHLPALVSLSLEYLKRGEAATAQPYAERAAILAPGNFAAHTCLGRVRLEGENPDVAGAIRELEMAAKLAPDSPQVFFSLASAYAKAGRKQDAEKARAHFARLKKLSATAVTQEVR